MSRAARVPVTVAPTVGSMASGRTFGPRMEGFNTVQTGGMAARQNEALGGAAMDEFAQLQHQANELNVTDAVNKLQQQAQDLSTNPETGYMRLKGAQAVQPDEDGQTMVDSYSGKINAAVDSLGGTLTNPLQRQMFMERAGIVANDFRGRLMSYYGRQHDAFATETSKSAIQLATQQAILGYNDPATQATSRAQIGHAIAMQADTFGWDAPTRQAATQAALGEMNMGIVRASIGDGNTAFAADYFQKHKDEFTPEGLIEAGGMINHSVDGLNAINAVKGAQAHFAGQLVPGGTLPSEEDFVDQAVKLLPGGASAEQIKATQAEAENRYAMITRDHAQAGQNALDQVLQSLDKNGGSMAGVDPRLLTQLQLTNPGGVGRAQDYAKLLTQGTGFATHDDPATITDLFVAHPEKVATLSDAQFKMLRTQLTESSYRQLGALRRSLQSGSVSQSPDTLNETVFRGEFNVRMRALYGTSGVPMGANASQDDLQRYANTLMNVRDAVFHEQMASGHKFTDKELTQAVDRAFLSQVPARKTHWFGADTTEPKPAASLQPADLPSDVAAKIRSGYAKAHPHAPALSDNEVFSIWRNASMEGR